MKPGKASFDFVILRQEGARWRYRMTLEGTEPEPDDVIEVESNLLVTSTISFKMTNTDKVTVPFKAKFTSDSGTSSSIQPISFQLNPKKASSASTAARVLTSTWHLLLWSTAMKNEES
jgi:hypothetical protein